MRGIFGTTEQPSCGRGGKRMDSAAPVEPAGSERREREVGGRRVRRDRVGEEQDRGSSCHRGEGPDAVRNK